MAFSQAFLDWEEATEAKGEAKGIAIGQQAQARSLVIRLLARRIGILPAELRSQVEQLSVIELESLGEALLDFEQRSDLTDWLDERSSERMID
jgi:predicted transposase YdaD